MSERSTSELRPAPPMNRDQLVQALRQGWRAIPDAVIRRLTNCPMPGPFLHTCTWWTYTLLKHVLCGQIDSPSSWVVLYEITHFTPSAVVNCEIVLLSILLFIYRQIIILPKITFASTCFVLFLILWKNNWYTFFWTGAGRSSEVERSLMVRWVVGSILAVNR